MAADRVPTRPTSRLSEPRVGPSDACEREQLHPRTGQLSLDLASTVDLTYADLTNDLNTRASVRNWKD